MMEKDELTNRLKQLHTDSNDEIPKVEFPNYLTAMQEQARKRQAMYLSNEQVDKEQEHQTPAKKKEQVQPPKDVPVNKISQTKRQDDRLAEMAQMQEWIVKEPNTTFSSEAQKTVFDEREFQYRSASFDSYNAEQEAIRKKKNQNLLKEWRDHVHYSKNRPFNPTYIPTSAEVKGEAGKVDLTNYRLIKHTLLKTTEDLLLFEATEESLLDNDTLKQTIMSNPAARKQPEYRYPSQRQSERKIHEQVVQEVLLQGIPDEQSMEPLAQLDPLPGRQRRAMNRSLSWIMEQEQEQDYEATPYTQKKSVLPRRLRISRAKKNEDKKKGTDHE